MIEAQSNVNQKTTFFVRPLVNNSSICQLEGGVKRRCQVDILRQGLQNN